jgi:pyrroloquinoline quinone biosynthesis protein E
MDRPPQAIIAEITHRCPLHCVYCSNPVEMRTRESELPTEDWARVFREAGQAGALQLHLTGGEPLARNDLTELVAAARAAHLYVNLITSGLGLTEERLDQLTATGLDHIQLSFQDAEESEANEIAGTRAHERKLVVAEWIRRRRLAFTVNLVVHQRNLDRLDQLIRFSEELQADRLEIANVQYYGWALRNRSALLPTREQVDRSLAIIEKARERLKSRMRIDFVFPDYYARYPKPCMGGWGSTQMLIDPGGRVLPCHAAGVIPGLEFDNVQDHDLRWIWTESAAFRRFRGEEWMQEPCRSCERRSIDYGGCRCQAFLLTGDACATDPVCSLAPARGLVDTILAGSGPAGAIETPSAPNWVYRIDPV